MSYNISTLIDCPTVQLQLNAFTDKGQNPNEPAPEVQFLTSALNTNRVLETRVVDDGGTKIKTVQVVYTPRLAESSTSTSLTKACDAGNEAGMLSTTYQIDPNIGVESVETIEISDLARICQSNPDYFAQRVNAQIDVAVRKMQTVVATQMSVLNGWFAQDNGETGVTGNAGPKTVATKYAAAVDGGKWNPEALQEIIFSTTNSGFKGTPFVFGYGAIWRYWNYLQALGNVSDGGLDFAKYVSGNSAAFVQSMKMHNALNGSGAGSKFLVVDPGSLFLLQYNRYNDPLIQNNDDALVIGTIVDPKSGVEFNYKVWKTCAEQINIKVSTAFKVVGLPTDMYGATDRLYKTNGVLLFDIANS